MCCVMPLKVVISKNKDQNKPVGQSQSLNATQTGLLTANSTVPNLLLDFVHVAPRLLYARIINRKTIEEAFFRTNSIWDF